VRAFRDRVTSTDVEMCVMARDGRSLPILVNARPLEDTYGRFLGAVAVYRDIEPIKRLERLRQEWAAMIAHDLRQPLAAIKVSEQSLAMQGDRDSRDLRAFATISRAVGRMNSMIEELLDVSLLEVSGLTLNVSTVDLETLLRSVVESFEPAGERLLRVQIDPGLPAVRADAARLTRVLENLISNAFKYGVPGGHVVVSAAQHGGLIEVAVSNTGEALTPDEVRNLFSRFYRAPSTRQRERGLGLGLYISRGIVEAHGGHLVYDHSKGRTSFRFVVPVRAAAAEAQRERRGAE
jgi:signal transduction histidine kinase